MTGSSKGFLNYLQCLNKDIIRIIEGSFTPISKINFVSCTINIKLSFVLHVSYFSVNILSVSTLTKTLNYKIEFFFPDYCSIQDLKIEKRTDNGRLHDSLYILEENMSFSLS